MCEREKYEAVAREEVVAAEHCSPGHRQLQDRILARVSIILVGDTWAATCLCCETLMGTLLWGNCSSQP